MMVFLNSKLFWNHFHCVICFLSLICSLMIKSIGIHDVFDCIRHIYYGPHLLGEIRFRDYHKPSLAKGRGNVSPRYKVYWKLICTIYSPVFKSLIISSQRNSQSCCSMCKFYWSTVTGFVNQYLIYHNLNTAKPLVNHSMGQYIFIREWQTGWWLLLQIECPYCGVRLEQNGRGRMSYHHSYFISTNPGALFILIF